MLFKVLSVTLLVLAAVIGAAAFGIPAWIKGTQELDRYIDISEKDEDVSNRRHRHIVRSERRRRRLLRTLTYSLLGALLGAGLFVAFAVRRFG
jgi:predicted nucleic acid-binding Zn ribbon protein